MARPPRTEGGDCLSLRSHRLPQHDKSKRRFGVQSISLEDSKAKSASSPGRPELKSPLGGERMRSKRVGVPSLRVSSIRDRT